MRSGKLIFLLTALGVMLMAVTSSAQIPLEKIDFGFKLGTGISQAVNYDGNPKSRVAYLAGGFAKYGQNDWFSIQLELLYTIKGYKLEDVKELDSLGNVIGQGEFEFTFGYLEMPLLARLALPVRGKYSPFAMLGGFAAYNINNRMRLVTNLPFDFDIVNAADFDYGLIAGAGLDIKTGEGSVFIETRYDMGLGKVVRKQDQMLRAFTFQIGYKW